MKKVMVSELKAKLSAFLAAVRAGESLIVCDRRTPVARIVPFEEGDEGFQVISAKKRTKSLKNLPKIQLRKPVDVVDVLREDRDQR